MNEAAARWRASRFSVEPLESRTFLSVSRDDAGWTVVTPSADTQTIYVSSSQGDDANSGLSPDAPLKTVARGVSMLRDGMPDRLLLKRGDTFQENLGGEQWEKSGRSPDEPLLVSAYGEGSRPLLETGNKHGIFTMNGAVESVAIIGLAFRGGSVDAFGVFWLSPTQSLLIEDSSFDNYGSGMVLEGNGVRRNVTIRRNIITNSAGQGFYTEHMDNMLVEENVFDHNGWNANYGSVPTVRKHSIYIKENNTNVTIRGNIIANSSSHGVQARSGGIIEDNLFLNNPIGLSYGFVNGSPVMPGGVTGRVSGNVFLGSRDISGFHRGWAMEISNIMPGSGAVISDNIIAHDTQQVPNTAAIWLTYGEDITNPEQAVGINDLTLERNIVYDWYSGLGLNAGLVPGGSGATALNGLTVRDNHFSNMKSGLIVDHASVFSPLAETWQGNFYNDNSSSLGWFSLAGVPTSLAAWLGGIDPTGSSDVEIYLDPTRNMAGYSQSLGGLPSEEDFMAHLLLQSQANWRPAYTARAAIGYIRAGFFKPGDVNRDGSVSIADFITLAENFGLKDQDWFSGDLNGDGSVSISDLIDLSTNFQPHLPAASPVTAEATAPQPALDLALEPLDSGLDFENNDLLVGSPTSGGSRSRCLNRGLCRLKPLADEILA